MSEPPKKKLLFIKSPLHNLKAIESFLTKRNYEVIVETDIKEALLKVIELQSEFVLVALDHSNPQIMSVPKILRQSSSAYVIPYVQGNSKEAIRKLEFSGFPMKIYPPLSGPAIERMILKLVKDENSELDVSKKSHSKTTSKEDMIQIKSQLLESLENEISSSADNTHENKNIAIQKGVRGELLKTKNKQLEKQTESHLSVEKKSQLKIEFDQKMRASLEDMIETYEGYHAEPIESNETTLSSQAADAKLDSIREMLDENDSSGPASEADQALDKESRALIKHKNAAPKAIPTHLVYCITVQSLTWCGYLVIYSDCAIDFSTSQSLFKDWLSTNLENLTDLEETEQFEIELKHPHFKDWAQEKSDHYELVKKNKNEILLSFFSIDPRLLIVEMNENDLIEIPIRLIPLDKELNFSLYLHLPENKKFLLYTPPRQAFTALQQKRLSDKKVEKLYITAEFEKDYRKLMAETHMNELFEKIQTESSE